MTYGEQKTLDEQRLSEMLHRVTPEPPRPVTVEDIAIRLANQAAPPLSQRILGRRQRIPHTRIHDTNLEQTSMSDGHMGTSHMSEGRILDPGADGGGGRGPGRGGSAGNRGRRLAPLLAAASVVVVVAGSAGIAVALTSDHHKALAPSGAVTSSSTGGASPSAAVSDTGTPVSQVTNPPTSIGSAPWGAKLIVPDSLSTDTLTGSGNSLFAITDGYLVRMDPATGSVVNQVAYPADFTNAPVVTGNTVWVVWSWGSGSVGLRGFSTKSLAPVRSITVPSSGQFTGAPEGIVTAGPDGKLYVAAGSVVAVVNPSTGSVIRQIPMSGAVSSIAVSPDGSTLYAGTASATSFGLAEYDLATGSRVATASQPISPGGDLVATDGGVWYTTGLQSAVRVWFAPSGSLSSPRAITAGFAGGQASAPSYADGVVWVGGTQRLECLNPDTGQVLASAVIMSDNGVPVQYGNVAAAAGRPYAIYQNDRTQTAGAVSLTPPPACAS
jgi:sugar lactone lactonase YvrE